MEARVQQVSRDVVQRLGAGMLGWEYNYVSAEVRRMLSSGGLNVATLSQLEMRVQSIQAAQGKKSKKKQPTEKGRGDEDENVVDEAIDAEIFESYKCSSLDVEFRERESGQLVTPARHPGHIAESGLLASVSLPKLNYSTEALAGCVARGVLSDLQLEGALHACQRFCAVRSGVRAGFFLGDGAGVGKGRQIAAIIYDQVARGRGKHIWFSISSDLRVDAQRDLCDVGCHVRVIDSCQSLDAIEKLAFGSSTSKRGIVFSTYSTLISAFGSSTSSTKKSRLDQLVEWCGGSRFEGCLIFDEAHKAKSFNVSNEKASTKMATAAIEIQKRLPLARVVYASATGVSEISHMAYCERLGLWGPSSPFAAFSDFHATLEKRGVSALEMLSLELKASGAYVSRGLSWSDCDFEHTITPLTSNDCSIYDQCARWWRALHAAMTMASSLVKSPTASNGKRRIMLWQRFWGAQLRFFKELQTALKVPAVVSRAKQALAQDQAVVIGLQSTGEAGLDTAMRDSGRRSGDTVPNLVSAAKISARNFVREFFPVAYEKDNDEPLDENYSDETLALVLQVDNKPKPDAKRIAQHSNFLQETNRRVAKKSSEEIAQLVALRDEAIAEMDKINVPPSPLDALIDALGGTSMVAEMTGRSSRVVRRNAHSRFIYENRVDANGQHDSLNIKERKAFMDGKKSVAIISDAASTGVSLHAANGTASAHKRRVHITLELAWSADKSIQQLGRSHRANQASAPSYVLLTTNLGGENRFAAAVAKRLQMLGALTKGDRRAASGQDLSEFDVDNKLGRTALGHMASACSNNYANAVALNLSLAAHPALTNAIRAARDRLHADLSASGVHLNGIEEDVVYDLDDSFIQDSSFRQYLQKSALLLRKRARLQEPVGSALSTADELALPILARRAYAALDVDPKKQNDVRFFLNRLQALDVVAQNILFEYFCACLKAVVTEAKANGTLDAGVADIRASSAKIRRQQIVDVDAVSGAQTVLSEIVLDRGVDWTSVVAKHDAALEAEYQEEMQQLHESGLLLAENVTSEECSKDIVIIDDDDDMDVDIPQHPTIAHTSPGNIDEVQGTEWAKEIRAKKWGTGFYMSRRPLPTTRKQGLILAVRKAGTNNFIITRPNTGTPPFDYTLDNLREKYQPHLASRRGRPEDRAALRKEWNTQYDAADTMERGGRRIEICVISGVVMPFWQALQKTADTNRHAMTKAEQALKVVRVCLDDDRKLVGIRFPVEVIGSLRANLNAEKSVRISAARTSVQVQQATPIDEKALKAASTQPKTINSFFKPAPKRPAPVDTNIPKSTAPITKKSKSTTTKKSATKPINSFFSSATTKSSSSIIFNDANEPLATSSSSAGECKAPTTFCECPCCGDLVETAFMNRHLDNDCIVSS
mmetsp:Transcript_13833/g.20720  ORF Transcript_13833/g.20720 Transcript_13833/m.20720 type:complete len:1394 (+) Transcript_13833:36-4217(+)